MANASPSQGSTYEKFDIISLDGSKTVPLKGGVVEFQYFEDLFSPVMTAKLTIVNTASPTDPKQRGIYNDLPIRGGERVDIHITTPIELALKSFGEFKMSLYVNNISGYVQEKGMETFTLHLISKEGLLNQNTRVIEKTGT